MSVAVTEIDLLTGAAGESPSNASGCTFEDDLVNFQTSTRSHKMVITSAQSQANFRLDPINTGLADPIVFGAASIVKKRVFVSGAENVTNCEIEIYTEPPGAGTDKWVRTSANMQAEYGVVKEGWNTFEWAAGNANTDTWGQAYRLRPMATTTGAAEISFDRVWVERPATATARITLDSCYEPSLVNAWPALLARGYPVTLAPDPLLIGTNAGDDLRMTLDQIRSIYGVNGSVMSWHGYTGDATSAMSAAALIAEEGQAIAWLRAQGFMVENAEAAITQNTANALNEALGGDRMLLARALGLQAQSTFEGTDSATSFPVPADRLYNLPRLALSSKTQPEVTDIVAEARATGSLMDWYIHSVTAAGGGFHTSQADFDHFMAQINAGVDAGELAVTTFSALGIADMLMPTADPVLAAQAVRNEIAIELARLDVGVGTRSSHAAPDLSDATAAKVAAEAIDARVTEARAAKLDRDLPAVGDAMTLDMAQATPGASSVGAKLDAAGTGGGGDATAANQTALDTKLDTVLARTAGGIVVSSLFLDVDGRTLLLRQGEAYTTAASNPLEIAVKDARLTAAVTTDGTIPRLKLTPRNKVGAATTIAGSVIAFHSETSTVDLRFELNAATSAALKAGARVYRWDIDLELAGNANNVLAAVIDHPCTVAEQVV